MRPEIEGTLLLLLQFTSSITVVKLLLLLRWISFVAVAALILFLLYLHGDAPILIDRVEIFVMLRSGRLMGSYLPFHVMFLALHAGHRPHSELVIAEAHVAAPVATTLKRVYRVLK